MGWWTKRRTFLADWFWKIFISVSKKRFKYVFFYKSMCWVNHTWEGPVWGSCWVHLYPFLQVWHLHLPHLQSPGSSPLCPESTGYYFRTAFKYAGWSSPDEQFRNNYPHFKRNIEQKMTKIMRDKHNQLLLNLQNIVLEVTRLQNLVQYSITNITEGWFWHINIWALMHD